MEPITVYVFDSSITPQGAVDVLTGLNWGEKFSEAGSFELWCPLNDQNAELLREDYFVWLGGTRDTAGIIEFKELEVDEEGTETIHVRGRLLECILERRTLYPAFIFTGKAGAAINKMVDTTLVNPTDTKRKVPLLSVDSSGDNLGAQVSFQKTGGDVLSQSSELAQANGLGFKVFFNPRAKSLTFKVLQGTDRTIDQSVVNPVYFASDLDDILESGYSHNKADFRNVAYVAGEDSGANREVVEVGTSTGLDRREVFVDARDLQSEKDEGGTIPADEYTAMLQERGKASLEEYKDIQTFSATIRTFGVTGYEYGVDFFLGDLVTVYDRRLKVRVNAIVTAVELEYDTDGQTLQLTFGYQQPTLANKLKRRTLT